jgi:hypothetical protein
LFYSNQYYKIDLLHLIVAQQLSGGWQHNYSTKTRQAGHANEQSMYSWLSMVIIKGKISATIWQEYRYQICDLNNHLKKNKTY